jgi:hypothetical protein
MGLVCVKRSTIVAMLQYTHVLYRTHSDEYRIYCVFIVACFLPSAKNVVLLFQMSAYVAVVGPCLVMGHVA